MSDEDSRASVSSSSSIYQQLKINAPKKRAESKAIMSKTSKLLSTSAKRIQKELADITLDPPPNCSDPFPGKPATQEPPAKQTGYPGTPGQANRLPRNPRPSKPATQEPPAKQTGDPGTPGQANRRPRNPRPSKPATQEPPAKQTGDPGTPIVLAKKCVYIFIMSYQLNGKEEVSTF
ncbi:uncharacterized protein LOC115120541 isoform X3 [Oncorhynchus nerka]|uniref:uncharacterized protein LOC115120541 isoform X3 n=1 Tax=Oncorhynchus nerka TaxID=8023 RepID=UPI0031B86826